jgi:nitrate/nitrite transporter NarK
MAATGDAERAARDLTVFSGTSVTAAGHDGQRVAVRLTDALRSRRFLVTLLGTAGSWFFFNVAVYGNSVSQPLLIKSIAPDTGNLANIAINAALVIFLLDRIRRKTQQILGFALSALSMLLIAAIPGLTATVVPFALVFGISLFGIAVGPNYSTMLLAAECYPTSVRSTAHGLSAGIAKIGAFVGALATPLILAGLGLRATTLIAGACFVCGILTTLVLTEPKDAALDEVTLDGPRPMPTSVPEPAVA